MKRPKWYIVTICRRKFRSQNSNNMDIWKSRAGQSQTREEMRRGEERREEKRRGEERREAKRREETRRDETRRSKKVKEGQRRSKKIREDQRRSEKIKEDQRGARKRLISRDSLCFSTDLWLRRVEK